jgi:predicted transcriptional regulator
MIAAQMTKREAKRRLENLALETGHKRNYYVKKALVEFLDRNKHLAGDRRTHTNGLSAFDEVSFRANRYPF